MNGEEGASMPCAPTGHACRPRCERWSIIDSLSNRWLCGEALCKTLVWRPKCSSWPRWQLSTVSVKSRCERDDRS
eukprot:6207472-Pleurochrysis_carterae.AAC.2